MIEQIQNTARPSWQEVGRLSEKVGLPSQSYRAASSDSVLDKSAGISLFQNLFRDLLIEASQTSKTNNPGYVLEQKLLGAFFDLFPELPKDISRIPDALSTIRYISHPTNRSLSTASHDLERLTLSVAESLTKELLGESVTRGRRLYDLQFRGFETEGARELFASSIRLAAIRGLSETLIHSGDIGTAFNEMLLSKFRSEPYHALSALHTLAKVNVAKRENSLSNFNLNSITGGRPELTDALNARFKELKPQVHILLDEVVTYLAGEALKKQLSLSPSKELALRLQLLNYDAVKCLDQRTSSVHNETISEVRERVVDEIDERVVGDMLIHALTAWEAMPNQGKDERKVDLLDAIMEIRRQRAIN